MYYLFVIVGFLACSTVTNALQEGKCEGNKNLDSFVFFVNDFFFLIWFWFSVCVGVLNKLLNRLTSDERSNPQMVEQRFKEFCLETKKAENRFVSFTAYFLP